jgi:hypothetical protein
MATNEDHKKTVSVPASVYAAIQNWILQQQEHEATFSEPAPLTDAQRKAILDLELAVVPATAQQPEPEIGDVNWIGLLNGMPLSMNCSW